METLPLQKRMIDATTMRMTAVVIRRAEMTLVLLAVTINVRKKDVMKAAVVAKAEAEVVVKVVVAVGAAARQAVDGIALDLLKMKRKKHENSATILTAGSCT
mmetsp:Transcript_7050/g.9791  ORF Transcript_7050/g.9791 Transcript_7050/m.9791 type:complete len:102 (-) Transcript_7050:687-992(-)